MAKFGKADLQQKLRTRFNLTKDKAAEIVHALFDAHEGIIAGELKAGRKLVIPGFGTFRLVPHGARTFSTPSGKVHKPAGKHLKFKVGKTLAQRIGKV